MLNLLTIIDSTFRAGQPRNDDRRRQHNALGAGVFAFHGSLPIWARPWIWPLLLLPLCAAVSVVYKCIRCKTMSRVPIESTVLFITIILGMAFTGGALAGLAALMQGN